MKAGRGRSATRRASPALASRRTWAGRALLALLALAGLVLCWRVDGASVERGNRLQRRGAAAEAGSVYEGRLARAAAGSPEATAADRVLRYNLGTAQLDLGDPAARGSLSIAGDGPNSDVRARALYNLGVHSLRRALEGTEGDSLRVLATEAVEANRAALRIRPDHDNTKWNLAIAQRLLDSIRAGDQRTSEETAESALEADEIVRSETILDVDEENELPEEAPMEGEDEARADLEDELPLSEAEAADILSRDHWNPALLLQKLLALESRSFFGRRPTNRGPRR